MRGSHPVTQQETATRFAPPAQSPSVVPAEARVAPPPQLSILMPVWNERAFLESCIGSIRAPEGMSIEVVLVDDGSTDATGDIAARWAAAAPFPVHIIHAPHRGKAAALNLAYARASGACFILLAGDDLLVPERLADRVAAVVGPGPRLAQCGYRTFWHHRPDRAGVEYDPRRSGDHVAGGAASFNRAFAEIYFPIPEELPNEDTWLRAAAIATGTSITPVDGLGLLYRIHPRNSVGPLRSFAETDLNLQQRHRAFELAERRFRARLDARGAARLAALCRAERLRQGRGLARLLLMPGLTWQDRTSFAANASPLLYALKRRAAPLLKRLLRL